MASSTLLGIIAGAAGSSALNIATYLDMAVRGRAASTVPGDLAEYMLGAVGIELSTPDDEQPEEAKENRKSAAGALFGYVSGLGIGALYGAVAPHIRDMPLPVRGVVAGLGAMAASDVPAIATGVTDPAEWGAAGWASDAAFHVLYGIVTVWAHDLLLGEDW